MRSFLFDQKTVTRNMLREQWEEGREAGIAQSQVALAQKDAYIAQKDARIAELERLLEERT